MLKITDVVMCENSKASIKYSVNELRISNQIIYCNLADDVTFKQRQKKRMKNTEQKTQEHKENVTR